MSVHSDNAFMLKVEKLLGIKRVRGQIWSFTGFSVFTQVVNVLRSQLAKLDEIKKERETMEGEIKAVTFDMSVSFLTALAQDGTINEEQLSVSQLDQLYGSYNQRVQASLRSQEDLLGQIQVHKQMDKSEWQTFRVHTSAFCVKLSLKENKELEHRGSVFAEIR